MIRTMTTRREFIGVAGAAGGLSLLGRAGGTPARGATLTRTDVLTRPNIKSLAPDGPEIASIRRGVAAMKLRTYDDPTGWTYQAAMHGSLYSYYYWNLCKHGNWWFFPWHRMYLYYFERILRDAAADPNLTLPYWNWADPLDASQRAIPDVFRNPSSEAANPLYDSYRDASMNSPTFPALLSVYDPSYALSLSNFIASGGDGFGGQASASLTSMQGGHGDSPHGALESYPHDSIHTLVGGTPFINGAYVNGHMSLPATAGLDPIFWFHHANIDRLWKVWHRQDPVNNLDPTNDDVWMNETFTFFDESKAVVTKSVSEVLDTVNDLAYRYDDDPMAAPPVSPLARRARPPAGAPQKAEPMDDHMKKEPLGTLIASAPSAGAGFAVEPSSVSIALPKKAHPALTALPKGGPPPQGRREIIQLAIEGIKFDVDPGAPYAVFLNLADPKASPCDNDIHFAGIVSFFGLHSHPGPADDNKAPVPVPVEKPVSFAGGGTLTLDVSKTVRALQAVGRWDPEQLKVTFIRRDPNSAAAAPQVKPAVAPPVATMESVSLRYKSR